MGEDVCACMCTHVKQDRIHPQEIMYLSNDIYILSRASRTLSPKIPRLDLLICSLHCPCKHRLKPTYYFSLRIFPEICYPTSHKTVINLALSQFAETIPMPVY